MVGRRGRVTVGGTQPLGAEITCAASNSRASTADSNESLCPTTLLTVTLAGSAAVALSASRVACCRASSVHSWRRSSDPPGPRRRRGFSWWPIHLNLVITGATIVAFSFIGFDAITMYTEEAKDPSTVPKTILLALLIGGAIFLVCAWITQSLFPDVSGFSEESLENSALPEIAYNVGGQLFKILLTSAAFAATVASSLASHASVSRMLYVMGRNGRGPVRKREIHSPAQIVRNVILPGIGVMLTVLLWAYLSAESTRYGIIWFVIGLGVLLWITRFLRQPLTITMGDH